MIAGSARLNGEENDDKATQAWFSRQRVAHQALHRSCECGGAAKLDFGIFDSRYLLIWHLDANRCVVGGRLVFDQAEIRSYSNIFSQLWTVAKDLVQPIS